SLAEAPDLGRMVITIRDEGPGMTLQTQARVFEPFFTTKPEGSGTGMGLAVVHGLVEAWGGTIGLESAPGSGTKFVISFPINNP
ncbi:sensor histidine kinase, partial [Rhodospirillum rubrum]